ncbi:MAG: AzlC family ABC transporter permease [Aquiluna sp.]|nr:AzlC family ABC transporter permease [Aquiluna sp.]MDP4886957.1 AzlC family ABC transporter permease [Aquiluna sp.]
MTKAVVSTSLSVALATGLYGVSFGAIGVTAGLDVLSVMLLSLLMFSGASQFAFVGVVAAGGAPITAIASAWLMGVRNSFYALRLAPEFGPRGLMRFLQAQLTIDESNAVSAAQDGASDRKLGFWLTGVGVFVFWNLATLLGALGGNLIGSVEAWGLDAAAAAAFLGLLWPRLRENLPLALAGAAVALASVPFLPAGLPILLAAAVALLPFGRKP